MQNYTTNPDENLRDHGNVAENSFHFLGNHVHKVSWLAIRRSIFNLSDVLLHFVHTVLKVYLHLCLF